MDGAQPANAVNTEQVVSPAPSSTNSRPSLFRAWCYLVWLSILRQARMRQMVWIALALLGFSGTFVGLLTAANRWDMHTWRFAFSRENPRIVYSYQEATDNSQWLFLATPRAPLVPQWEQGIFASVQAILDNSPFPIFIQSLVLAVPSIMLNFLLPIWSLSFATDSIGGDRENRNLIWLLTRPLPRWAIYLAKFVAVLPWTIGLNVGGVGLLCLAGGEPGRQTFAVCWPAILCGTFAFTALFLLIGAYFQRPAVVSIVYSFFLEIILGNMPGYFKRASISFYMRCMIYETVEPRGIVPSDLFVPVQGWTALIVLLSATAALLLLGMFVFSRTEYHEVS